MRNYDFSPLNRSSIGFDRIFDLLDSAFTASQADDGWPPYNIVKAGEDVYRIEIALSGFAPSDLEIVTQENMLTVTGRKSDPQELYLHHGIPGRAFERRFNLADHLRIASANLSNGLLTIELMREVPEALRPRKIEIETSPSGTATIEQEKAA